jgi:hypothetical protein
MEQDRVKSEQLRNIIEEKVSMNLLLKSIADD